MYLRSTPRRNKDGSEVRYLQLAHNVWDPAPGAGEGTGRRGGGPGVRGVAAAGRDVGTGRAVGPAGHRPGDAPPAGGPAAGRLRRAGAVRAGGEPGAGPV